MFTMNCTTAGAISAETMYKGRPASTELNNPAKRRLIAKDFVIKPSDYVKSAFRANGFSIDDVKATAIKNFEEPTKEMLSTYTSELLSIVRKNNTEKLKELHCEGKLVNACNQYSESLLHLSCRRSYTEMTRFLIKDVKVSMNIRDDYFRTPLHDACWTISPNFELVDMLIREAPEHLVLEDVRGFTPFDYIRNDHWKAWLRFLWERKDLLRPKKVDQVGIPENG
jgi:hypothetical protein